MAFTMPHPFKDKKTGIYYLRVRVPAALKRLDQRSEVVKSLRTRDPAEAKSRFAEEYAKLQKHWAALQASPQPIPHKRIMALAGRVYAHLMDSVEDEPGEPAIWMQVQRLNQEAVSADAGLDKWYGETVDEILSTEGIAIDKGSRERLLTEVHAAWSQASDQQLKRALGDYSPDPRANRFPTWEAPQAHRGGKPENSLTDLFEVWRRDHIKAGRATDTIVDFRRKLDSLVEFIGHEDARAVDKRDIFNWIEHLQHQQGVSPRTVKDKYLAAVRTIYRRAQRKLLIDVDPTQGLTIDVAKKVLTRPKGFTDREAKQVLRAANAALSSTTRTALHNKLACRWVPWICAYTGARAGEITQLRKEDFSVESGIDCITITPEAGTVKTGNFRLVPVHPHLVEMGLIEFVRDLPEGIIFRPSGKTPSDPLQLARNTRDKVAVWVRKSAKISDKRLQPNHAWRHLFKTVGRDSGIGREYLDAIQGHTDGSASAGYGEYSAAALYREICKIPWIELRD